tara:strand:- start:415 stop:675 length:261 start_codon:yes stop_codon:yes gene_type:complete
MVKKILRAFSFVFITIFIATSTLLLGVSASQAAKIGSADKEDKSMGIVIEESSENIDHSKTSEAPDLGDDQAFPFIPGFGKNSGKD